MALKNPSTIGIKQIALCTVNAECQIRIMTKLLLVPKALLSDLCFVLEVDKKMRRKKMRRKLYIFFWSKEKIYFLSYYIFEKKKRREKGKM